MLISGELMLAFMVGNFALTIGSMIFVMGNSRNKVTASLSASISEHANTLHVKFDDHQDSDTRQFQNINEKLNNEIRTISERSGEMGHALAQRLTDIKDWTRDNCALEKNLQTVHASVTNNLAAMDLKADARASVIDARLIAIERGMSIAETARVSLEARVTVVEGITRNH